MTFRDGRFKGKVAIVSGGADGMGAACVNQLSAEGAKVAILDIKINLARAVSATLIARCVSSSSASATSANTSPVAGLVTLKRFSVGTQ